MTKRPLTAEQLRFLVSLPRDGQWWGFRINRSALGGRVVRDADIRQQCRRRGLAECHPAVKRRWRLTDAGRAALQS